MNATDAPRGRHRDRIAAALLGSLLVVYVALCVDGLTRLPKVHADEMWNAAPAFKLATTGVYGSDLFKGYYDADRWTYQFMPLLQILLAVDFKLFGVGLLQIRLLSVTIGVVALWLTYLIGRRVGGVRVGLFAVWILAVVRMGSGSGLETGVVFVDMVRQTRYHVLAAACGAAALAAFLRAEYASLTPSRASRWYVAAGMLAGLAFLSHMYGVFWIPALGLSLIVRHGPRKSVRGAALLLAGFIVVCLPWFAYIAANYPAYIGQMRLYSDRFNLFAPGFYLNNVVNEINRYLPFGSRNPFRMGLATWIALLSFPIAVGRALLSVRAPREAPVAAVVVALVVIASLYALLLQWKTFSYVLTLLPLVAVLLADLYVSWWDRARTPARIGLIALVLGCAIETSATVAPRHRRALDTTPYSVIGEQLAACVPNGAVVVAPHQYWLPLRDRQVRTWVAPLLMTEPATFDRPIAFDTALERINPDILITDERYFAAYFNSLADPASPRHEVFVQLTRFRAAHHATTVCTIRDDDYGTLFVERVTAQLVEPGAARPSMARRSARRVRAPQ